MAAKKSAAVGIFVSLFVALILVRVEKANSAFAAAAKAGSVENNQQGDTPEAVLGRIHTKIGQLLGKPQPELYERHLRSVLALSEDGVFKLQFAGPRRYERAKELLGISRLLSSVSTTVATRRRLIL
jgi:hypothetical protein